ncbi:MAG: hypothetical protein AAFV49_21075 [Pseudomonadota bacterium]
MGAWGGGLYANDTALDLRSTISVLATLPLTDETVLSILLEENEWVTNEGHHEADLFWYVVADQFNKRGIVCERAQNEALDRLSREPGAYSDAFTSETALREWRRSIQDLSRRLRQPPRERQKRAASFPEHRYAQGDVLAFPTMLGLGRGNGLHIRLDGDTVSYHSGRAPKDWFKPDGWGCVIVTEHGFVFDVIPYLRIAPVLVSEKNAPTLVDVRSSKFLYNHVGKPRVYNGRAFPNASNIGRLVLDTAKLQAAPQDSCTPRDAVLYEYDLGGLLVGKEFTDVKASHERHGPPVLNIADFVR